MRVNFNLWNRTKEGINTDRMDLISAIWPTLSKIHQYYELKDKLMLLC